jgi:MFS family permease
LLDSTQNSKALGALIFARIVYALNWTNLAAIFYLMQGDLGTDVTGLGTVNAAFYLGIGIFQIPGGLLAAKYGPKKTVVVGIFLTSFSVLGTAGVSNVFALSLLRFVVGAGMAFVFAPGVVIVTRLLRGGRSGMGVGLFNSAFDVGGLVAFGWVVVAEAMGWRPSLLTSGLLGLLTGALTLVFLPKDDPSSDFKLGLGPLARIMTDRRMALIGLGMLSYDVGNVIISGFMVLYLVNVQKVPGPTAALVASLITVIPIFTALWAGRLYDSRHNHRLMMELGTIGSALSLAFGAYPTFYAAIACAALGGVVTGLGYTFGFAGARELNTEGRDYEGLAISWVNSIHLTGSFIPPIFFASMASSLGYSQAWLWSAALTMVLFVPILLLPRTWRR